MSTKEEKIDVVKSHLETAKNLASLAEKANHRPSLNKAKKMIKQVEDDLSRLNAN
jgi:hypothetical protein